LGKEAGRGGSGSQAEPPSGRGENHHAHLIPHRNGYSQRKRLGDGGQKEPLGWEGTENGGREVKEKRAEKKTRVPRHKRDIEGGIQCICSNNKKQNNE